MPSENDVRLTINLVPKGTATLDRNLTNKAIGIAIGNVGFRIASNKRDQLAKNLQRDFAPIVERELSEMARMISTMAIGIGNPRNPPTGQLKISGRISQAMLGQAGPMSIASVTGKWAERSKVYLKSKFKKYRTRKWFYNTGQLQGKMAKLSTYHTAYGPMKLTFKPASFSKDTVVSGLGRSSGGQSNTAIAVGKVEVTPLRRIDLGDLPGIGQPAVYSEKLMGRLPMSVRKKLSGRKGKYRPVIEPFLTYYLNRKIPNAVFLKLEDTMLA